MFNLPIAAVLRNERMLQQHITWLATALVMIPAFRLAAEEPPSPMALLRGVEAVRTEHDSLRVNLTIEYVTPQPAPTIDCLIEMAGSKRRCEFKVLSGDFAGQVILRDGDEFYGYRRKKGEDVNIYDAQEAVGLRGDIAFDPRILGLSDLMSCNTTVKDCLWYEDCESLDIVGQESFHGVNIWKVRVGRGDSTSEFWIEEPSFRVHRKTTDTPRMHIVIESEYDLGEGKLPFPRMVTGKRVYTGAELRDRNEERIYTVQSFDAGAKIPVERFTLRAMSLPFNTAVVDYRIQRIVGYWDGEGLSENPVYQGERPVAVSAPSSQWGGRVLPIVINVAVVLGLIVVIWMHRSRASTGA